MLLDPEQPSALINLTKYCKLMGITRQAVHYQRAKGICAVPPVTGTKPPKWRLADVDAYKERMRALAGGDQ